MNRILPDQLTARFPGPDRFSSNRTFVSAWRSPLFLLVKVSSLGLSTSVLVVIGR